MKVKIDSYVRQYSIERRSVYIIKNQMSNILIQNIIANLGHKKIHKIILKSCHFWEKKAKIEQTVFWMFLENFGVMVKLKCQK